MGFTARHLLTRLRSLSGPEPPRYLVAFSGGLDSHVLLHALASLRPELTRSDICAVHIHHGLQPQADGWTEHCRRVCEVLEVDFTVLRVSVATARRESVEAAARTARYRAFKGLLEAGEVVLTAHHRDDQAETLLLQLLRGAGPAGLAGMPEIMPLGEGRLVRPLLEVDRGDLMDYARAADLRWVDDPMNLDLRFDRSFLRQQVIPVIRSRWPAYAETLSRAAGHQAEARAVLDELAESDLAGARGAREGTLSLSALGRLPEARRRNLFRGWLRSLELPLPNDRRLRASLRMLLEAREDAEPVARWRGAELRRYRDDLYAMKPLGTPEPGQALTWDIRKPLRIPGTIRVLRADDLLEEMGLDVAALPQPLTVRFRQGGERCRPKGRRHTRELKKLLQEADIPPWERERIPLLYAGDRLVAVIGYWVCA